MLLYNWGNEIAVPGVLPTRPGVNHQEGTPMVKPQHTPTPENEQEEWRPVVGYEGWYEVSNLGRVRRVRAGAHTHAGRLRTATPDDKGYPQLDLYKNGKGKHYSVHCLVAYAFLGPCPTGYEVNHKDRNPANPQLSNLEYVTKSQNSRHAFEHGRIPLRGEEVGNAKLTGLAVLAIRNSTESQSALAARYGVSQLTIRRVRLGDVWKHAGGPIRSRRPWNRRQQSED